MTWPIQFFEKVVVEIEAAELLITPIMDKDAWVRRQYLSRNAPSGDKQSSPERQKNHLLPPQGEIAGFCGVLKRAAQPQKGQHNWDLAQSAMSPYP